MKEPLTRRLFARWAGEAAPRDEAVAAGPRVLLIGTSNAVFTDGYAAALAGSDAFASFENRSVGLASSALFSVRAAALDFSRYDLCILDFCCNDASLLDGGATDTDMIRAQIEDAIATIAAAGCLPVILIYPIAKVMPDGGPVRDLYRRLALAHGLPFLDVYDLFARAGIAGSARDRLFIDDMHMAREPARAIGRLLVAALARRWPVPALGETATSVDGFAHRMAPASALVGQPGDALVERRTRLIAATCADLPPSHRHLSIAADEEVVAVAADVGASNGYLTLRGQSATSLRLSTEHHRVDGSRFVVGVWPVYPPVAASAAGIDIIVGPEAMDGSPVGRGPLADGPTRVSLVGLVLRRPVHRVVRRRRSEAADLADDMDDALVHALVAAHDEALWSTIVDGLYLGLLGRHVDPDGLTGYATVLKQHGMAAGIAVVCGLLTRSAEFRDRHRT